VTPRVADLVAAAPARFPDIADLAPWAATGASMEIVAALAGAEGLSVHPTATVEAGAVLKPPLVVGPGCFIAAGAYLRGGCWLDRNVVVGPNAELKSSFLFEGSKLAHLNFVGDSVLGADVNVEAGTIVANYRNERDDKAIRIRWNGRTIETCAAKFGAICGDGARIGANAVIAPGAVIDRGAVVPRLSLLDQSR